MTALVILLNRSDDSNALLAWAMTLDTILLCSAMWAAVYVRALH